MNDRDKERIGRVLNEIDLQYVEEAGRLEENLLVNAAAPRWGRSLPMQWLRWIGTAAVVVLAFIGAMHLVELALGNGNASRTVQNDSSASEAPEGQIIPDTKGEVVLLGGIPRMYKSSVSSQQGGTLTFPVVLPAGDIQYSAVIYNGQRYTSRGNQLRLSDLDHRLGSGGAVADAAGGEISAAEVDVYAIRSVSEEYFIAVEIDGKYICFMIEDFKAPATLGEFLDAFSPVRTVQVQYFYSMRQPEYHDMFITNDDNPLWEYMRRYSRAQLTSDTELRPDPSVWIDNPEIKGWVYDFEISSPVLGNDDATMYLTSDGRMIIDLFGTPIAYTTGVDAWAGIFDRMEYTDIDQATHQNFFIGTVTETGEDYILVDDTISCREQSEGLVFRIETENLIDRDYIYSKEFEAGDKVYVGFQGRIDQETMTVNGVFNIGVIYDIRSAFDLSDTNPVYDTVRDADGFIRKIVMKPEMDAYRKSVTYDPLTLAEMEEDAKALFRVAHEGYLTEGADIVVRITEDKNLDKTVRYYMELEEQLDGTATGTHALMQFSTEGALDQACIWDSRNGNLIAIEEAALIGKRAIYERGGLYDMMTFVSSQSYLVNYGDSLAWLVIIEHNQWISNTYPFWGGSVYTTFYVDAYNGEILEYQDN
ncbi:MAG: hypothetical protein IJK56_05905 [Firmicutes bacterium]|nr:hypothetical protein [Bacillota bacterium]